MGRQEEQVGPPLADASGPQKNSLGDVTKLAEKLLEIGDPSAEELCIFLYRLKPDDPSGFRLLLQLHRSAKSWDQLLVSSWLAEAAFPEQRWWRWPRVNAMHNLELFSTIEACNRECQGDGADVVPLMARGRLEADLGQFLTAIQTFDEIVSRSPSHAAANRERLRLLVNHGSDAQTIAGALETAVDQFPKQKWWHQSYWAHLQKSHGKWDALSVLQDSALHHKRLGELELLLSICVDYQEWNIAERAIAILRRQGDLSDAAARLEPFAVQATRGISAAIELATDDNILLADLATERGDFNAAADHILDALRSPGRLVTRSALIRAPSMLATCGRFTDAESILDESSDLTDKEKSAAMASVAARRLHIRKAREIVWENSDPSSDADLMRRAWSALADTDFEVADLLISHFEEHYSEDSIVGRQARSLRTRWLSERYEHEQAALRTIKLLESGERGSQMDTALHGLRSDLARLHSRADLRHRTLAALERHSQVSLESAITIAHLQITNNEHSAAKATIKDIPDCFANHQEVLTLRAWLETSSNNHSAAKELGTAWCKIRFRPPLHQPVDHFYHRDGKRDFDPSDIVAVTPIRNELHRLPDFLRHHRTLGIDHFIFLDNMSTDDSENYLREHDDVTIFRCEDDFVAAASATRWINLVLDRFLPHNWALFLDADEHFVFPDMEKRSIHDLTDFLATEGSDAVGGFMLDMHPAAPVRDLAEDSNKSYLERCPMFTNTYSFLPNARSPYFEVGGGFRDSVLGQIRALTKVPLVNSSSGVRYHWPHSTTPAAVSTTSSVLLHFKELPSQANRSHEEASWGPSAHFQNGLRENLRERPQSFSTQHAVTYENSAQLIDLQLLNGGEFLNTNGV